MDYVVLLGYAAGILTTVSYVPELIDTVKTKDVKDLSFSWLGCLCLGMVLWTYYGYMIGSDPLLVLSAISFIFVVALLGLKLRYK